MENQPQRDEDLHEFRVSTKSDISRRDQTTIILFALALCMAVFLYYVTRGDPRDPRTQCQQLIGYDKACLADQAGRRIGLYRGF
mgnify:CR=1 FL=1